MEFIKTNKLNPNPITKFLIVILLGLTVVHTISSYLEFIIICIISIIYILNGFKKESIITIIWFLILSLIPNFKILAYMPSIIKIALSLVFILRMFYLPYVASKFLVKTSDVGTIISSLDYIKVPKSLSIPIAVMFRFFPSFIEEKNSIMMAMKIRGINTKNPIKYLEYVAVPLLIISSNIADDISRAAETKCIASPIKKTRYIKIGINLIDYIYFLTIFSIVLGGWLW